MAMFHTEVLDNQIKALPTIATASGSIATFTTDKAENLVDCECEVASGASEVNIIACGKNLMFSTLDNYNIDSTGTLVWNTSYKMCIAKVEQGKTYSTNLDTIVCGYFNSMPVGGSQSLDNTRTITTQTFTALYTGYIAFRANSTDNDVSLKRGNDTTYTAYNGTTYNIQLGETLSDTAIYNAVTGVLTRNDTTTKQLDSCPIVTLDNEFNNIWSDTGDIEAKFVLSVGSYVNQNT